MVYPYNGILFSHKREWSTDTYYDMYEPWRQDAKWNKPDTKRIHNAWFHLFEVSRAGKLIMAERIDVIRKPRGGVSGELLCNGYWGSVLQEEKSSGDG